MENKDATQALFDKIREKTEIFAKSMAGTDASAFFGDLLTDIEQLAGELHSHQVELMMQNDELRRVQGRLETSRHRYFELYDLAPTGHLTIGTEGRVLEANHAAAGLLKKERRQILNALFTSFVHPPDMGGFRAALEAADLTGRKQGAELRLRRVDGSRIHVKMEVVSAPFETETAVQERYRVALTDMEAEFQYRNRIERSKEEWERTFDAIGDFITIMDARMKVRRMNSAARKFLGVTREEAEGRLCYELFEGAGHVCAGCPVAIALSKKAPAFAVMENKQFERTLKVSAFPYFDADGTVAGVVQIAQDLTEKLLLEQQLMLSRKMEAVGLLAAGVSRRINNLLSIIVGNNELALSQLPEWSPARDHLEEIHEAGLRARDVVRQLLTFSRRGGTEKRPVYLSQLVRDSMRLIRPSAPKGVEVRVRTPDSMRSVLADPAQVNQALIQLCTNACEAMADSGGVLTVEAVDKNFDSLQATLHPPLAAGSWVQVTVSDTGPGIAPEVLPRVFEPFFSTREFGEEEGKGMGLAMVHGIMKRHDGVVHVDNHPGKGVTAILLFPAHADQPLPSAAGDGKPVGNESILVVDDDASIMRLAVRRLQSMGYRVEGFSDPKDALDRFTQEPGAFDILATDMAMPGYSGIELAREARKLKPDLPVIVFSAYVDRYDADEIRAAGIRKILKKPLERWELARAVRTALDREAWE